MVFQEPEKPSILGLVHRPRCILRFESARKIMHTVRTAIPWVPVGPRPPAKLKLSHVYTHYNTVMLYVPLNTICRPDWYPRKLRSHGAHNLDPSLELFHQVGCQYLAVSALGHRAVQDLEEHADEGALVQCRDLSEGGWAG